MWLPEGGRRTVPLLRNCLHLRAGLQRCDETSDVEKTTNAGGSVATGDVNAGMHMKLNCCVKKIMVRTPVGVYV